ncbi:ABC transporter ATP-binding protein [Allobacillus halotolerans]|uniref:Sn-glycerol-3-phosphate ABC transporter ATP-binding protein UgpC n=1 Tax=Allobacillus halotolerans TaxID=570278 RepID=A0ABS6GPH9_9BACI|nr:sn-glycerol-3-phosphate ABC transporter ATP-binding protein UgpC [Allobacillus halotolerans]MBU6081004.1 sn-glycerol-3-phosphate ABC transporter ATP-binding protein UgpC [Allobacillus halotolerans]
MTELRLENLSKSYDGKNVVVNNINLHIHNKEFIVLVGPSGCGKSTTLRMIAGLENPSSGNIYIDEKRMNDLSPKDRDIAMVFQHYALYPHMTVYGNMAFGLKLRKFSKKEIDERVKHVAQILDLKPFLNRKPKFLSGGQRQRVALGRAIVRDSKVFLMDEPLSNLDAKLRVQMRAEIQKIHQELQTTTIYVTHDQVEAMTMATRLVVMHQGEIQQIGAPKEIFDNPKNTFVAGFIGSPSMNLINGTIVDGHFIVGQSKFLLPEPHFQTLKERGYENKPIILGIRPENISESLDDNYATFEATVRVVELLGSESYVYTTISGQELVARVDSHADYKAGDTMKLAFDLDHIHFFDYETEERIS